ncbi:hypothetical protein NDU88_000173 [Pleurodeles waltl]|uniref:Uncharacterized protein n=1 Tax=Pleurodeles waltl TaxID=8319 RepID=A0AAV7L7A9_PLEWA|nr:hypothetical protein NDU88_000173 [Pleurodeles waltl]
MRLWCARGSRVEWSEGPLLLAGGTCSGGLQEPRTGLFLPPVPGWEDVGTWGTSGAGASVRPVMAPSGTDKYDAISGLRAALGAGTWSEGAPELSTKTCCASHGRKPVRAARHPVPGLAQSERCPWLRRVPLAEGYKPAVVLGMQWHECLGGTSHT